ncbi:MAG TPA: hypothetical protein VKV02_00405 [Acidobacteriaceae bacterium]|nr:hypothetical protein [Acidobacteriaceae bacterium]
MNQSEGRLGDEDGGTPAGQRPGTGAAGPGGSSRQRVGGKGREGSGSPGAREEASERQADLVPVPARNAGQINQRSPLYHAQHANRYQRQQLIREYEKAHNCRLIVMVDAIFSYSFQLFGELLSDVSKNQSLHLLLWTPGGDGEVAVRLARAAQAACREFTVIVPDIAKSAGTLLALGADQILMSSASDLGPVDPQFEMGDYDLISAKDIIAAVDRALNDIAERPETYPLYSAMLSDVNALRVERARSALARTDDLLKEALRSNPRRSTENVEELAEGLQVPLISDPKDHAAILGAERAVELGLPVTICDPASVQWRQIWQIWMYYYTLFPVQAYEGAVASQVHRRQDAE